MRKVTPDEFVVYPLDELEPDARQRAIEGVAEKLGGEWWDQCDTENVGETIVYALATALGTPGREQYGEGDFPGIDGVKLEGWDLDRGSYLALRGALTPKNAPALTWSDGVIEVMLTPGRNYTSVSVEFDDEMATPDVELIEGQMETAVEDAMHAAMKAGREQMEYIGSKEAALEHIEANEREFYADGTLYF